MNIIECVKEAFHLTRKRVLEFIQDPFLKNLNSEDISDLNDKNIAEARSLVLTSLLIMVLFASIGQLVLTTSIYPLFTAEIMILFGLFALTILGIAGVCVGFVIAKVFGSPQSFSKYCGGVILDLPLTLAFCVLSILISMPLSIEASVVKSILLIPISATLVYRKLLLAEIGRTFSKTALGLYVVLIILTTIAKTGMQSSHTRFKLPSNTPVEEMYGY